MLTINGSKILTVLCGFLAAWHVNAVDSGQSLVVLDNPILVFDSNANAATGWLRLRNNSTNPITITLSARSFTNLTTSNDLGTGITFTSDGKTGPLLSLNGLTGGTNLEIRLDATNLWEAGESETVLLTNGIPFTSVAAERWRVPFGLFLVGNPSNDFTFESGRAASLIITNADPLTYRIRWDLTVAGQSITNGMVMVLPGSQAIAGSVSKDQVFSGGMTSFFNDQVQDSQLILTWEPLARSATPLSRQKIISTRFRNPRGSLANTTINLGALLLLVLGAATSWALNLTLPNVKRRGTLASQIAVLAERTHSLSPQIDSSLRVLLRVQRLRLDNLLSKGTSWSPAMAGNLDELQTSAAILDRQVTTVERIDRIFDRLVVIKAAPVPPTTLALVDDGLDQASRLLRATRPTDADQQAAEALIRDAEGKLDRIGQSDDALSLVIARRVALTDSALTSAELSTASGMEVVKRLPGLMAVPFFDPRFEQAANVTPDVFQQLDAKSHKLEVIGLYLQMLKNVQAGDRQTAIQNRHSKLMEALELEGYINLQRAERLIREMQQGVYAEGIKDELVPTPPRATVEIGQSAVRPYEPVQVRVVFRKSQFNLAAARDEFIYQWAFGDGLTETGPSWIAWHFYVKPGEFKVTVTVFDGETGALAATLSEKINVVAEKTREPFYLSDKAWAETTRVALALLAPILALVAGAREKLLQVDLPTAIVAIFLMGFTANTIKDLLTQGVATTPPKSNS